MAAMGQLNDENRYNFPSKGHMFMIKLSFNGFSCTRNLLATSSSPQDGHKANIIQIILTKMAAMDPLNSENRYKYPSKRHIFLIKLLFYGLSSTRNTLETSISPQDGHKANLICIILTKMSAMNLVNDEIVVTFLPRDIFS